MSDRERHRVAVVVFADIEGVDYDDACSGAELAIRHALSPDKGRLPVTHRVPVNHVHAEARVVAIRELGLAQGNRYVWTRPTRRAWRESGLDFEEGDSDE